MTATRRKEFGPATRFPSSSPLRAARPARALPWVIVAAALVLLLGFALLRLSAPGASPPLPAAIASATGAAKGWNVVLLTLDTLRADRVGCYGYQDVETPVIDGLAAAGVRFASAATPVPITLPAHTSILTGDYPPTHGVRDNGKYRLSAERITLAERLRDAGYETAAFIAAFVLDRRYGLDQGFDVYDDQISRKHGGAEDPHDINPQRPGNVVTDAAIQWLEGHVQAASGRPFFAWVHLFDPHTPYTPPEPFKTRYAESPYDGEVAFTDQQVGRFVEKLRELKLLERSLVVVAGDHGEGLGDHGESNHSLLIYGSTMMVPLIFHGPEVIPAGQIVDDRVVSLVDVMPTILDLLGLDAGKCDGTSLLRAETNSDRAVYLETVSSQLTHGWSPLFALQRHHDKYIEAPKPEYYDLTRDPGELQNLFSQRQPEADTLKQRLAEVLNALNARDFALQANLAPDTDALAKLAALGYVGDVGTPDDGPLPDPKDMIADWERTIAARVFVEQGRHALAIPLLEELAGKSPNDPGLWSLLSYATAQAGSLERAVECRLRAIDLQPDDANYWLHLADLQHRRGDREASIVSLDRAERLEPDHGGIILLRARHALDAGELDPALALCVKARETDPTRQSAAAWTLQAQVYEARGDFAEAQAAYERAHDADPSDADAIWGLARVAEREGRLERVIELGAAIPRTAPHWPRARGMMARAHLRLGQGDEAIAVMREVTETTPDNPGVHNDLGNVLYQLGRLDEAEPCYRAAIRLNPRYTTARYNLAMVLRDQGHVAAAITELQRLVELAPTLEPAVLELAGLLDRQGEPGAAIDLLRQATAKATENANIACALAWRLATSPQDDLRDGAEALRLAEHASGLPAGKNAQSLDALAAAYAELGRFDEAVATAQRALRSAQDADLADLARDVAARLQLYQSGQPYRVP